MIAMGMREHLRGNALYLLAGGMLVLLGAGAWAVDSSAGLREQARQREAAEAGALAATHNLLAPVDEAAAKAAAVAWIKNSAPDVRVTEENVEVWSHDAGARAVTVSFSHPVATTFGRLVGVAHYDVQATASATLGGVVRVPKGFLPIALPAQRGPAGGWQVQTEPGGEFRPVVAGEAPTVLRLRLAGGNETANAAPLAIGGNDEASFRLTLRQGASFPLEPDSTVQRLTGATLGAAAQQALLERTANDPAAADVLLPLVDRAGWDGDRLTVIGVLVARLTGLSSSGEIEAVAAERVLPEQGDMRSSFGAGGYAPVLIPDVPERRTTP